MGTGQIQAHSLVTSPIDTDADEQSGYNKSESLKSKNIPRAILGINSAIPLIELFTTLLEAKLKPQEAWTQCLSVCTSRTARHVVSEMNEAIEGGERVSTAMKRHPRFFGDLLIKFVKLGESDYGLAPSLRRYIEMREQSSKNFRQELPRCTSAETREFALVAGTLIEMGVRAPDAFWYAAREHRRRFRDAVYAAVRRIHSGTEIDEAFREKTPKLFQFTFDPFFRNALRIGVDCGKLGKILVEFGSKDWSRVKI